MVDQRIGVLGATSGVGRRLLSRLAAKGCQVTAYSRGTVSGHTEGVTWCRLGHAGQGSHWDSIALWISAAPIWVIPEHLDRLVAQGARRIVALSSTSRFTKGDSSDGEERATAYRLAQAEDRLQNWAEEREVDFVILRPTLSYGMGLDKNVAEIARFIRRFGFFPTLGRARGLRQPVHVDDVAAAVVAALFTPDLGHRAYDISGGEVLTYREMVVRVFTAMGRPVRILSVPLGLFRIAVTLMRQLPRYRHWTAAMAERMNRDLVFDHSAAARDFQFDPRPFCLSRKDVSL